MESSRRDLSNDMAEHESILKNNQNTHYLRFSSTLKTGMAYPKRAVLFLLCLVTARLFTCLALQSFHDGR